MSDPVQKNPPVEMYPGATEPPAAPKSPEDYYREYFGGKDPTQPETDTDEEPQAKRTSKD